MRSAEHSPQLAIGCRLLRSSGYWASRHTLRTAAMESESKRPLVAASCLPQFDDDHIVTGAVRTTGRSRRDRHGRPLDIRRRPEAPTIGKTSVLNDSGGLQERTLAPVLERFSLFSQRESALPRHFSASLFHQAAQFVER